MVRVPGAALSGIATVSCIVIESASGLANNTESVPTTGPEVKNPRARTLIAVFPITVTRMDLPSTAEAPENGLRILTSGGGTFPVAIISVSTPEVLPAPSVAVAVMITGVPGGTRPRREKRKGPREVGDGAGERSVVNDVAHGAEGLHMDVLESEIVLGLGRKRDYRVSAPADRSQIERRRNSIRLRIDRRRVVTGCDTEGNRRRNRGHGQAAAQNASEIYVHSSHL